MVAAAGGIASSERRPAQAIRAFDLVLDQNSAHGLVTDMARRALARAVADGSGPSGFASALFSEAVSYYVSRELPSYVGSRETVRTTSSSIDLKNRLREITRQVVSSQGTTSFEPSVWRAYVQRVVQALREVRNLP